MARPQDRRKDRSKGRSKRRIKVGARGAERSRQMTMLVGIAGMLAIGLFVGAEFEFGRLPPGRSLAEPAATPSDDEIYTGSILYMPEQGSICRQFLFDNRTGRVQDNGLVDCEQAAYRGMSEAAKQWSTARALVISESFRQH